MEMHEVISAVRVAYAAMNSASDALCPPSNAEEREAQMGLWEAMATLRETLAKGGVTL